MKFETKAASYFSSHLTYVTALPLEIQKIKNSKTLVYLTDNWRRPPGWPCTTWIKTSQGYRSSLDLQLHEARELAQNQPLWRLMSLYSAMHS